MAFLLPVRTITAPDPDASAVPPVALTGCSTLSVGGTASAAGARLVFTIVFVDSIPGANTQPAAVLGTLKAQVLVTGSAPDFGKLFLGSSDSGLEPTYHCAGQYALIQVTAISPAGVTWQLGAAAH